MQRLYQFGVTSSVTSESVPYMQDLTEEEEQMALSKILKYEPNLATWESDD